MATYVQQNGQLTEQDGQLPVPLQPTLTTRYDDYILTSIAPGQTVTVKLTSADTKNYDPYLQVYELAAGQEVPLPGQNTVVPGNNDIGPTNKNSQVTFTGRGSGIRYLVRVTSFNAMPDLTTPFPATGKLPADYLLEASVPVGDITLTAKGAPGPVTPPTTNTGTPVHRFYDWVTNVHFYTSNPTEINAALAQNNPTGIPPTGKRDENNAFISPSTGNQDVSRFLNPKTNTYFYTSGVADIANANSLGFINQGIAFKSFDYPAPGTIPIYRFVDQQRAVNSGAVVHFFTPNEQEKNNVIANPTSVGGQWKYEGIGFFAYPLA